MYLKYYRYLENVGIHEDFQAGYRSKNELAKWQKKDPVMVLRKKLKQVKVSNEELASLEQQINKQVEKSREKTLQAPFPKPSELLDNTLYE